MRRMTGSGALLVLILGLVACSQREGDSEPVDLKADVAATDLQRLVLDGGTGQAHIGVSPDDQVHVALELRQDERRVLGVRWMSEATTKDLEAVKIGQQHDGDTLKLSVGYPSGDSHSDVKEEWTVQVPARFGVDADMGAGRMVIDGVSGGVRTKLSAGETIIHVAAGAVYARMGAGHLSVIADASQPGSIHVKSTFGLAVLDLFGTYYGPPEQHGGFKLFGNSVNEQGKGKDDFDLKVTAGLTNLRIGPQGDEKEYRDIFSDDHEKKALEQGEKKAGDKHAAKKADDDDDDDDD